MPKQKPTARRQPKPKAISRLQDLAPDPDNIRAHTPRNVEMIGSAITEVGAARSIVIDEAGTVLAGNATVEGAARAGVERVVVVDADGKTLVAVRRSGLTPEQKKRLALFDNRAGELAAWDDLKLADLAANDRDLLAGLFYDEELKDFIRRASAIPDSMEFAEYDEQNADAVQWHECPQCGHKWPK